MILASHNTMSYLRPKCKWLRWFRFAGRCQEKTLIDQHSSGVKMFDLRFTFDGWREPVLCHGIMEFEMDPTQINSMFIWMDLVAEREEIWCRIINEQNRNCKTFIDFCKHLKQEYPHIKFFGGYNKKDWSQLYDFGYGEPKYINRYASHNKDCPPEQSKFSLDDVWPWLYAKLFNNKWKKKYKDYDGYLMLDFV